MGKKFAAGFLLILGCLAAVCSYGAWIATQTVLDTSATRAAAHALLATSAVQKDLGEQVSKSVAESLHRPDTDPVITSAVAEAMKDPRVVTAFTDALGDVHHALLSGDKVREVHLDGRTLNNVVRDAIAKQDKALAAKISADGSLDATFDTADLPNLASVNDTVNTVCILAACAALVMIAGSLLIRHDRRAIARVGRRVAYVAIMPLLLFVVVPWVLHSKHGEGPEVVDALLRSYAGRVTPSIAVFVLLGAGIVASAFVIPAARPKRPEPAPFAPPNPVPAGPGALEPSPLAPAMDGAPPLAPAPPNGDRLFM